MKTKKKGRNILPIRVRGKKGGTPARRLYQSRYKQRKSGKEGEGLSEIGDMTMVE